MKEIAILFKTQDGNPFFKSYKLLLCVEQEAIYP